MEILKDFRKEKSLKELEESLGVQLPDKEVLEIINEIADLQEAILLLNLAWFLAYQIEFKRLIIAAVMVTLL
jgi:hypothetical protein